MRANLFEAAERGLLRNEEVLDPEHLPDKLPHREAQVDAVVDCVRPLLHGGRPLNVFLHGPPGIGKTAVSRTVLDHLAGHTERVAGLYVNCWRTTTRHGVLVELATQLGEIVPRQGVSTDEVADRLLSRLDRKAEGYVAVLDEVDRLAGAESDVLYDLLRSEVGICLVLISNDPYALRDFDERVRSSLAYEEVPFQPYGYEELKDILGERARQAFLPGACGPDVVGVVSRFVAEGGGDVRLGLECLLKAGREAERAGSDKVTDEHVRAVLGRVRSARLRLDVGRITAEERAILRTVLALAKGRPPEAGPVITGEAFEAYKASGGVAAERTFRKYLANLESLRILSSRLSGQGQRGNTRLITLAAPREELETLLVEKG